jgi:hypothetical protein
VFDISLYAEAEAKEFGWMAAEDYHSPNFTSRVGTNYHERVAT